MLPGPVVGSLVNFARRQFLRFSFLLFSGKHWGSSTIFRSLESEADERCLSCWCQMAKLSGWAVVRALLAGDSKR